MERLREGLNSQLCFILFHLANNKLLGHDNQRYLGINCQQIFFRLNDRKYVKNILRMRMLKL